MRRAAPRSPQSLTSLVDILFILVFAALVQRAGMMQRPRAEVAEEPGPLLQHGVRGAAVLPVPPAPAASEALRQAAVASLASELQTRPAVIARVSRRGVLAAIELPPRAGAGAEQVDVELPLIEPVSDPDVAIGYVGDRDASRRICEVVAARLPAGASVAGKLVVIAVDAPLAELTVALVSGLRRDVEQCLTERRAAAVLLDPAAMASLRERAATSPPFSVPTNPSAGGTR